MPNNGSMTGRTVLMTGATNGIGRKAAEGVAALGAKLTIVGRNPDKTEQVADAIRRGSGNQGVDHLIADLSSLAEVRQLAATVRERQDSLDVLVNNAGAMFSSRHETVDGYEKTFALNHLAYFLLTDELLPLLQAGDRPRIVNVASGAHTSGTMRFDDLMLRKRWSPMASYCQSKLANVLFTLELARRLGDDANVTVNCMHPGFVRSGFGKNDGLLVRVVVSAGMLFARSPTKGAETVIWLATAPDVEGRSGGYYMDRRERTPSREARDPDIARRLWEVSQELVAAGSE